MKINISEPVLVSMGPSSLTAGWGVYQFPTVDKLDDGSLLVTFASAADNESTYGSTPGSCISRDDGKTWEPIANIERFEAERGIRLPNGDRVSFKDRKCVPLEGLKLPEPIGKTHLRMTIYRMDEVDADICEHTWILQRFNEKHPEGVCERVKLEWPYMTIRSTCGVLVPPAPRGRLRIAPDGTLWMPHYYLAGTDPQTGELIPYLCNYLFHSVDGGRTWQLKAFLPFYPDPENPDSNLYEGYGENDITFTKNGTLVRLIRSHGSYMPPWSPCYITRSVDGGDTWSDLEVFAKQGVWPCLATLNCGVTLATYGRPGLFLRATADPSCVEWEDAIELVHATGEPEPDRGSVFQQATCGYSNMLVLDDCTVGLVYSDFRVTDESETPHKCIMYRTVRVEQ